MSSSPAQTPTPCRTIEPAPPTGLARLNLVPTGVQAGVVLVLVAVGVWLGGPVGGGLLLLVAAAMAGALALAWRVIARPERMLRIALAFLILAVGFVRLFPR